MTKKHVSFFSGILIICIALILSFIFLGQPKGQTYEISLTPEGFSPAEITINHGDSIKFSTTTNQPFWPASDLHPTHGIYPEFDPLEPVEPTNDWTFKFQKSGRWKFHDHLSPMYRGVITVK